MPAQNLIPNGSFEDTIHRNFGLKFPRSWVIPNSTSHDYYTPFHNSNKPDFGSPQNVAGFQAASSGQGYMGIIIYSLYANNSTKRYREYIQNQLTDTLKKDSVYTLELYVSLADSMRYASKGILGVYFSNNVISSNNDSYLPYNPQIIVSPNSYITNKSNWKKFSFLYTAMGGEKYITIGNFNDSNLIDTLNVGGGTQIWSIAIYYYIDDVSLTAHNGSVGIQENSLARSLKYYPNPIQKSLYLESTTTQNLEFQLYSTLGKQIEMHINKLGNSYELSTAHLSRGIYFLRVDSGEQLTTIKLVKE